MKFRRVGVRARATTFDLDSAVLSRSVGLIAGKWKVKIISHLFGGTKRFSELRRLLPIVHRGTLTYELRGLQADGIIDRTQYSTIPPTVEYKLTARGTALRPVLIALQRWGSTQKLEVSPTQITECFRSPRSPDLCWRTGRAEGRDQFRGLRWPNRDRRFRQLGLRG